MHPISDPALRRAALIALVGCLAVGAPAAKDEGAELVLPSEVCRGLFIVPVAFGDDAGRTAHLVLDTGAEPTSMSPEALRRILGREVEPGRTVEIDGGRIGDHALPPTRVLSHSMDTLSRALGREIDGILGFPTFREVLLTLDYPAGEVRVGPGRLPRPDRREIFRVGGGKRPHLKVDIGGRRVPILLDSGSTGRMSLRPSDRLAWSRAPRQVGASARFSGIRPDSGGRLAGTVRIGPLAFDEPIVMLTDGTRLAGWHVLRHFALTFDQKKKRVRMRASRDGPFRMPPFRGSGLVLIPEEAGFEVVQVLPDTSAERAGITTGDLIAAVDGTPVYRIGCERPWDDQAPRSVTLSVLREGSPGRVDVEVEVETLVP